MECKFCKGGYQQRIRLMENNDKTHHVVINEFNYLEDNITGGKDNCLYGLKINFCPMCGRKL